MDGVSTEDQREAGRAHKEAELLRRDREKAARAAEKEAELARRDAEKAQRDREKARRQTEKEAARVRAERERALHDAEKEAARAQREAEKAALDAKLAQQRAARQVERARRQAEDAGLVPTVSAPGEHDAAESPLPRALAVLWQTPEPGRRGPRPSLTLAAIADAAVTLADAEGLAAVSMARVAESLGVTTMALYRYVGGKDELLAAMTEVAVGPPPPMPTTGPADWRTRLDAWCRAQLDRCLAHPWIAQTQAGIPLLGPHRVAWLESGLTALDGTPLDLAERVEVIGTLSLHILSEGSVIAAFADRARSSEQAAVGESTEPAHPALVDYAGLLRRLVDPDRHPAIGAALDAGAFDDDPDPSWDAGVGLRVMLDGIAALIERSAAHGAGSTEG